MDFALKLEQRGLTRPAIDAWTEYVRNEPLSAREQAGIWYRIGTLYQRVADYEPALAGYYRSEMLAELPETSQELKQRIAECLQAIGKLSVLRQEQRDRVTLGEQETGGTVVAEIAGVQITETDLDQFIEDRLELQLSQYAQYLSPEQMAEQKEALFKQFATPEQRRLALEQLVVQEVLYRGARDEGIREDPATRALLLESERQIMAQRLLANSAAQQIQITDTDLQTYYKANLDRYREEERAQIRHVAFETEQQAQKALDALANGSAGFEDVVATIPSGSQWEPTWIEKGSEVPGIGQSDEAIVAVFTTQPGQVANRVIPSEDGFHVVQVVDRQPKRQKPFAEVEQTVYQDLYAEKERDVQTRLIDELRERYHVLIHSPSQ